MSDAHHVPGPWFIDSHCDRIVLAPGKKPGSDDWYVATCIENCGAPKDRAVANARLIAAAPELLAALTRLENIILASGEWDDGCFYHKGTSASEMQEPLLVARAAIAKAEGRS